jgi:hypothetical protein
MRIDWPVKLAPRWQAARPVLLAPTLPYFGLLSLCRRVWGAPLPGWCQAVLFPFAVLFLGVPTKLYESLGILTVLEIEEAN